MALLHIFGEAIIEVVGGLMAAALLAVLGWTLFKRLHHPELGMPVLLGLFALLAGKSLDRSSFLQMILIYGGVTAFLLWPAGRAWRRDHDATRR